MREKLIELLCTAPFGTTTLGKHFYKSVVDKVADYLLQNGVVVLPCKVGDTVHCLYQPPKEKTKIVEVVIDIFEIHKDYIIIDGYQKYDNEGFCYRYFTREIGKTVFLTREEAEKALERSKQ